MAEHHHPMKRLHHHLDQVGLHGAKVANAAENAAAAAEQRRRAEPPNDGREALPTDGA